MRWVLFGCETRLESWHLQLAPVAVGTSFQFSNAPKCHGIQFRSASGQSDLSHQPFAMQFLVQRSRVDDRFGPSFHSSGSALSRSFSEIERRRGFKFAVLGIAFAIPAFLLHRSRAHFDVLDSNGRPVAQILTMWISAQSLHQGNALNIPSAGQIQHYPRSLDTEGDRPTKTPDHVEALESLVSKSTSDGRSGSFEVEGLSRNQAPEDKQGDNGKSSYLGEDEISSKESLPKNPLNSSVSPVESKKSSLGDREGNAGRVAICIAGHARTFHLQSVHQSIIDNFVKPIRMSASSVDVFFHVGMRDVSRPQYAPSANNSDGANNAAMNLFDPVVVSRSFGRGAALNRTGVAPCPAGTSYASNIYYRALLRAHECMNLVRGFEKKHDFRYDWIVKTRPDIVFGDPVPSLKLLPSDRVFINEHDPRGSMNAFPTMREKFPEKARTLLKDPFSDHIAIVPRELADVYFSAHLGSSTCLSPPQKSRLINSETILGPWLIGHGVQYSTIPLFWIIVKPDRGPECSRVVKSIGSDSTQTETFRKRCEAFKKTGILEASSSVS